MMRVILTIILFVVLYHAVKTIFRSAASAYYGENDGSRQRPGRLPGEEMVQDPQCRTYVVKDRAVTRRVNGATAYFCSDACAEKYLRGRRS